jgi:hypothetical protein
LSQLRRRVGAASSPPANRLRVRTALLVVAAVLLLALAAWVGSHRLDRTTDWIAEQLVRSAPSAAATHVRFDSFDPLPAPVARYLRHVLTDGQPLIRVARFSQVGELRTDTESGRWVGFKARQISVPQAPGFVWDARVSLAFLLSLRVRDSYAGGEGSGRVTLLGVIPAGADSGGAELNSGALHRFLAEAVWYPTALLPSPSLVWSPIDSTKSLATLTVAGTTVSLEFWFNPAGEVSGIYSPGRWGRFHGKYHQVPWEGHFQGYLREDGMLLPSRGEVGWYSNGSWESVWKGRVLESTFEFDR